MKLSTAYSCSPQTVCTDTRSCKFRRSTLHSENGTHISYLDASFSKRFKTCCVARITSFTMAISPTYSKSTILFHQRSSTTSSAGPNKAFCGSKLKVDGIRTRFLVVQWRQWKVRNLLISLKPTLHIMVQFSEDWCILLRTSWKHLRHSFTP